ncbi:hypothetical protein PI124_g1664 [Phytophthora idaei]|nr:hypothetical protein PI125_g1532 [Phytophthora idaei]KAG3253783.1 hypothetical protein PI124_g1664 [Phytophthora idaei]
MKTKLNAAASIVHSSTFEAAAVKVINGEVGRLTASERKAVKLRLDAQTAGRGGGERVLHDICAETKVGERGPADNVLVRQAPGLASSFQQPL